jgi:hypothetical protein
MTCQEILLMLIFPSWLCPLVSLDSYDSDDYTRELVTKITLDDNTVPDFSWRKGLLKYKCRILKVHLGPLVGFGA